MRRIQVQQGYIGSDYFVPDNFELVQTILVPITQEYSGSPFTSVQVYYVIQEQETEMVPPG